MKKQHIWVFTGTLMALLVSQAAYSTGPQGAYASGAGLSQQYLQTNLVSDSPGTAMATNYDPNMGSSWGIAQSSTGPWFVNQQAKGLVTVYSGSGETQRIVVSVPTADATKAKVGSPTGIVLNSSQAFLLPNGKPATYLFCTLDGLIVGWNKEVPNNAAQVVVNQTGTSIFEGMAIASTTTGDDTKTYLYVPDFKSSKVYVYDEQFKHVMKIEKKIEKEIKELAMPDGFAPFNIQTVGPNLYITFGKPDSALGGLFPVVEAGAGRVVSINPKGKLVQVLDNGPFLNAPWAVTLAPGNFGRYSHYLLVGNNGDGAINVFNPVTGDFVDQLRDSSNKPILISGLWGLSFGNGSAIGGSATSLFFAASAGPTFLGGLFGTITPVQNASGSSN